MSYVILADPTARLSKDGSTKDGNADEGCFFFSPSLINTTTRSGKVPLRK